MILDLYPWHTISRVFLFYMHYKNSKEEVTFLERLKFAQILRVRFFWSLPDSLRFPLTFTHGYNIRKDTKLLISDLPFEQIAFPSLCMCILYSILIGLQPGIPLFQGCIEFLYSFDWTEHSSYLGVLSLVNVTDILSIPSCCSWWKTVHLKSLLIS